MHRLAMLTLFAALSWSQELKGPQPEPQPPITVKIEMPSSNPWIHFAEIVLPGLIGAGIAFLGVWLTNKNNKAANLATRTHELEKLDRQHTFEIKRDLLLRLTQSLVHCRDALKLWENALMLVDYFESGTAKNSTQSDIDGAKVELGEAYGEFMLRSTELEQAIASASLAVSDDLWNTARSIATAIGDARTKLRTRALTTAMDSITKEIAQFTEAARDELGIVRLSAKEAPEARSPNT